MLLANWFLQNNGDYTKYVYEYSLTVPPQVQTITTHSKPIHLESGFISVLY